MRVLFLCLSSAVALMAPPGSYHRQSVRLFADTAASAPLAGIQFYSGVYEPNVPDVKLTRSVDAQTGIATFYFDAPSFFNIEKEEDIPTESITAMTMVDEEGSIATAKVNARFVNGQPKSIEAKYEMLSPADWDRFMRFMTRYAEANGLSFNKAG